LEWVKNNNLPRDEAFMEQLGSFPAELSLMAEIGDPRSLPILRQGLSSPNYGVRAMAARGLALLQDKDPISSIIQAAQTAPSEMQWAIAEPLVAFDDSRARAVAEELVSDKKLLESDKQILKEKGVRGLWW
jgi:HEAT repeat protein